MSGVTPATNLDGALHARRAGPCAAVIQRSQRCSQYALAYDSSSHFALLKRTQAKSHCVLDANALTRGHRRS